LDGLFGMTGKGSAVRKVVGIAFGSGSE